MAGFRVLMLGAVLASAGFCSTITELESNGAASNNTLATAQAIPFSAFTTPAPSGVFLTTLNNVTIQGVGGGQDVDFYKFQASGPVQFSITDTPTTFPTIVSVFDSTGRLLAFDDSSTPLKPGSASTVDSYVGTLNLAPFGTYYVSVSNAGASIPNYPDTSSCTGFDTLTRPDGGFGGISTSGCDASSSTFAFAGVQPATGSQAYTLDIAQTPEPGTLGLVAAGWLGLYTWKRRNVRREVR